MILASTWQRYYHPSNVEQSTIWLSTNLLRICITSTPAVYHYQTHSMMQFSVEKKDGLLLSTGTEGGAVECDRQVQCRMINRNTLIAVRTLGICLVCLPLMKACNSLTVLRTGGYLLGAVLTVKYIFDVHPDDKFACMADINWITGHTYILYR
jgi:hypothetical protein